MEDSTIVLVLVIAWHIVLPKPSERISFIGIKWHLEEIILLELRTGEVGLRRLDPKSLQNVGPYAGGTRYQTISPVSG